MFTEFFHRKPKRDILTFLAEFLENLMYPFLYYTA
jgi:hypothetical protein